MSDTRADRSTVIHIAHGGGGSGVPVSAGDAILSPASPRTSANAPQPSRTRFDRNTTVRSRPRFTGRRGARAAAAGSTRPGLVTTDLRLLTLPVLLLASLLLRDTRLRLDRRGTAQQPNDPRDDEHRRPSRAPEGSVPRSAECVPWRLEYDATTPGLSRLPRKGVNSLTQPPQSGSLTPMGSRREQSRSTFEWPSSTVQARARRLAQSKAIEPPERESSLRSTSLQREDAAMGLGRASSTIARCLIPSLHGHRLDAGLLPRGMSGQRRPTRPEARWPDCRRRTIVAAASGRKRRGDSRVRRICSSRAGNVSV